MRIGPVLPRYSAAPKVPDEQPPSRSRATAALATLLLVAVACAAAALFRQRPTLARVGDIVTEDLEGACGKIEDGIEYHTSERRRLPLEKEMPSAEMCCTACEADPDCGAWTWGKKKGIVGLTHLCYLKELKQGEEPKRVKRPEVVSGLPSRKFRKHGVVAGLKAKLHSKRGNETAEAVGVLPNETCPGNLTMAGSGDNFTVAVVPGAKAGRVDVLEDAWMVPHMGSATYLVEACNADDDGWNGRYAVLKLLGKSLRYTVDLAGAGCGCNAMLYLASKHQSVDSLKDSEYKVDIQGGNQYAWSTQLHTKGDFYGKSSGYGGGGEDWPGNRDWTGTQYGPGGSCIDTSRPFDVRASFPVDDEGSLKALEVAISQFGSPCHVTARINDYVFGKRDGLSELSKELEKGMTLVINYTSTDDMLWLDGTGVDGKGPCVADAPEACPSTVRFYGFSVADVDDPNPELVHRGNSSNPMKNAPMSGLSQDVVEKAIHHVMNSALSRESQPPAKDKKGSLIMVAEVGGEKSVRKLRGNG